MILEFGERCLRGRQTQFESGVISENQLYMCWRFVLKESVSSVGQVEIVCRFGQMFVRVQLRFEKSSPRWRFIGREEIEEIKYIGRVFKLIGRNSAEIGSQKGQERSSQQAKRQGPVDRCAQRAQARPSRPWQVSSRSKRTTD